MKHRRAKFEAVEAHLGKRILGGVLGGEADHDRARHQSKHQPLAERKALHLLLVEVGVGAVHDELGEELVLHLVHGRAARVAHFLPGSEVLEVVVVARERRDLSSHGVFHLSGRAGAAGPR